MNLCVWESIWHGCGGKGSHHHVEWGDMKVFGPLSSVSGSRHWWLSTVWGNCTSTVWLRPPATSWLPAAAPRPRSSSLASYEPCRGSPPSCPSRSPGRKKRTHYFILTPDSSLHLEWQQSSAAVWLSVNPGRHLVDGDWTGFPVATNATDKSHPHILLMLSICAITQIADCC